MLHFKLYRGEIDIAEMEVLSVVEDFDVVEDGFSVGFTDGIVFTVHAFQLRFLLSRPMRCQLAVQPYFPNTLFRAARAIYRPVFGKDGGYLGFQCRVVLRFRYLLPLPTRGH